MKVGDLVRVTHGSGNGTVGVIASLLQAGDATLVHLHTGERFSVRRLEVISESR